MSRYYPGHQEYIPPEDLPYGPGNPDYEYDQRDEEDHACDDNYAPRLRWDDVQ